MRSPRVLKEHENCALLAQYLMKRREYDVFNDVKFNCKPAFRDRYRELTRAVSSLEETQNGKCKERLRNLRNGNGKVVV